MQNNLSALRQLLILLIMMCGSQAYASSPIKDVMWTFKSHAYNLAKMLSGDKNFDSSVVDKALATYLDGATKLRDNLPDKGQDLLDIKKRFGDLVIAIDENRGLIIDQSSFQTQYRKITQVCNSCHDKYDP
jgi:cytochrome c556